MMNKILKYIVIIFATMATISCSLKEVDYSGSSEVKSLEFIVRPTSFTSYNMSGGRTKSLDINQLSEVERRIVSAYFMAFDINGDRVIYDDLLVSNNIVATKKVLTDYGGNNDVTVCVLANVPKSYADSLLNINDLTDRPLPVTYAPYDDAGYVGIPLVDVENTPSVLSDDIYCFPMFGMKSCSLHNLESNKVIIELKRLFAKIEVNINLDLDKAGEVVTNEGYFQLKKYVIGNLPEKIRLTESKTVSEDQVILDESNWVRDSTSFIAEIPVDLDVMIKDDTDATNGHKIQFYAPEYVLFPDPDKLQATEGKSPEVRERMKPLLIADGTYPITVTINGMYYSVQAEEIDMTYSIFLGEDKFNSFSIFRNILYINNMTIRGATIVDNRVEMKYAGFMVGFPHSVQMDAHFNVRPLRLKFTDEFTKGIEEGLYTHGEIKIEVRRDSRDNQASWIALERPIESEITGNTKYSKGYTINGIAAPYPTKRRYFTTGLISELESQKKNNVDDPSAGSTVTFRTDEEGALSGEVITWVYVDEYNTRSADQFRQDTLAVTFTMDGASEGVTKRYLIRQSAIYPITYRENILTSRNYGIELFEEYTMNYDTEEHYDADSLDLGFHSDFRGIQWGLDGISLSRNKPALYLQDTKLQVGDDTDSRLRVYFETGFELGDYKFDLLQTIIAPGVLSQMETQIENLDTYYDFYTEDDRDYVDGIEWGATRDYDGFLMNIEIIHTMLNQYGSDSNAKLNGMILDETPLSAIAYCYNKNKRNANGEVISINSDGSLNISNYHWYAPAINEIEEIMEVAYNDGNWLNENFKSFGDSLYWSCQPAFLQNKIALDYNPKTRWTMNGQTIDLVLGFIPVTKKDQAVLAGSFKGSASGNFLQDDNIRARATKYDTGSNSTISSHSSHTSKIMTVKSEFNSPLHTHESNFTLASANTVANDIVNPLYMLYTAPYFSSLQSYLQSVNWSKSGMSPSGNQELETPNRGEGNRTRTEPNKVRCVYHDHSYEKATRSQNSSLLSGKKSFTTTLR